VDLVRSDRLTKPEWVEFRRRPHGACQHHSANGDSAYPFPFGKPFNLDRSVADQNERDPPQFMQVALDREHAEYLLARYRERLWLVLGTSLVLCALAGYLIARSGMRPIQQIGRTAGAHSLNDVGRTDRGTRSAGRACRLAETFTACWIARAVIPAHLAFLGRRGA